MYITLDAASVALNHSTTIKITKLTSQQWLSLAKKSSNKVVGVKYQGFLYRLLRDVSIVKGRIILTNIVSLQCIRI